ncbi:hypothetical protein [Candidatus Poriferisodalis sp.]|uniref:hypothetical protein n=1 Tax=Candidatus Poriferisodalis sp. TaxID=3101277 RepID=UPI003B0205FD
MSDNDTLLAYLVPRLTGGVEDAATDALAYILNKSESCREALANLVSSDDYRLAPLGYTKTQVAPTTEERLDLVGYGNDGKKRLIIESKFWARLLGGQASGYVRHLACDGPAVLLFVAPESRSAALWNEVCEQFESDAQPQLLEHIDGNSLLRFAKVGNSDKRVALTSWASLLEFLQDAASEKTSVAEIEQLAGLARSQDDTSFLPLLPTDFSSTFPRRIRDFQRVVGDIYWAHGQAGGWMDGKGLSVTNSSDGHGRYFRFPKMQEAQWIGISYPQWTAHGETPIWLRIWDSALVDLHALRQQLDASVELVPGGSLWVPILLRTGVMYEVVLDDAVRQVEAVRDAIRQVSDAAAGQA